MISLEFGNGSMMTWEGRSCNSAASDGAGVGVIFYGEKGTLKIEGGNAYSVYDMDNKLVKEVKSNTKLDTRDLTDPSRDLDVIHINNFLDTIRGKDKLNSDIVSGHQSTLLVQLGNIAQRTGETLKIDPKNGRILNSSKANEFWGRQYQPGWEPKI